jgi:pSer/pThr/pTyr-binding forkhead associated (FHA) protein
MADLILEIVEGNEQGRQLPLQQPLEVGRDPSVGLPLEDEQVSRKHARLEPAGTGAKVEDLGSTNGTYVNDQPLVGPRELVPGDRVRVGLTVLQLRSREQVAAQPSAVRPMPQITQLGGDVLQPVPEQELQPPLAPAPGVPTFAVEESEPAFVPRQLIEDPDAQSDFNALARLVDKRVKRQTSIATFALLSAAAIAVALFFGLR